ADHALPRGGRGALRRHRAAARRATGRARQRRRPAQLVRRGLARRRLREGDVALMSELLVRHRGLIALSARETVRVMKIWTMTIVAPILSSFLFILVFGLSLGGRLHEVQGAEYQVFIVPALITL